LAVGLADGAAVLGMPGIAAITESGIGGKSDRCS
jgi:hypothetical protein